MERIVIVDEHDNYLGEQDKELCHQGKGILHRGFLTMIFNTDGELLLTRRSAKKRLWPGFWDGSVASHVFRGESYEDASLRRLKEEVGLFGPEITYLFKFHYMAGYEEVGTEHEICAVTMVRGINEGLLEINKDEISEIRSVGMDSLLSDISKNGNRYTPWLILAVDRLRGDVGGVFTGSLYGAGGVAG